MKRWTSKSEALQKLQRYCAYHERSHKEVRGKLLDLGIYGDDLEEVIAQLIADNFLNEERFARAYARGKFRMKQWGKRRIVQELKRHQVSDYSIRKALEEIPVQDYVETLREIIQKKNTALAETDDYIRRNKIAQYAISRGYEPDVVWQILETSS
ncbi:MAG: RecX family transcriptional regulator [Saprospiraceae bacterium]|nr:RecX family transcriptional regulator [Saprospiraceae bacterium]